MRQVDILKHAHTYLEQLSDYVDPITRKPLPKGSAARDDSVHKLIAFCRGDLKKMIDYDAPELDGAGRNPHHISKQDRVIRNARLRGLERLSQGCHPDTGAPLDPQDPLGREELRRCFAFVAQCLRNTLNAGYFTARAPFALSPEARSRVPISPKEPISLPELVKTISAQREDDTAMRGLRIEAVAEYLFSQGLLTRFLDGEQTHTPKGEALGFVCKTLLKADDPCYGDVLCAPAAQQYVLDHLDDITAARWTQVDPAVAGQPIPQDVDDQARALSDAFRQAGGPEERQADALVRAKNYLEQLRDYTDPLTGEYLTGDQTVRSAGVNRLFFSCAQALEKMIAYDSGVKKSVSSLKDLAFWQQRAQGMERLARGCHPETGAGLEPKNPLAQEGLRECFAFVGRCLYRTLNNGFFSAKVPFSLPPEARPNSPFSKDPIRAKDMLEAINARREDETAMRPLSSQTLLGYLASQGLLTESPGKRGAKKYDLSPRSEEMGISQKEDTWDGVPYMQIVYGPAAQQFVIDHLDDVIAFRAKK